MRGTEEALVRMECDIVDSFSQQKHLFGIFFYTEKSYDTTWKFGILQSIHNYGIRGALACFIKNFLQNFTSLVNVHNCKSPDFSTNKAYRKAACWDVCCSQLPQPASIRGARISACSGLINQLQRCRFDSRIACLKNHDLAIVGDWWTRGGEGGDTKPWTVNWYKTWVPD